MYKAMVQKFLFTILGHLIFILSSEIYIDIWEVFSKIENRTLFCHAREFALR